MLLNDSFLSSSGNCIARRTTIWLSMHNPASMLTLSVLVTGYGLQWTGRVLQGMNMAVDLELRSTFSRVPDRTAEMVSHTMMLNGVSLFWLGILALATTLFQLSLASRLATRLASNTGNAFFKVGLPIGILQATLDLSMENAFPAVKVRGLLFLINPLILLVLVGEPFTAGATRRMSRGVRCNTLLHDTRKFSVCHSGLNEIYIHILIGVRSLQLKGSVGLLVSTNPSFKT